MMGKGKRNQGLWIDTLKSLALPSLNPGMRLGSRVKCPYRDSAGNGGSLLTGSEVTLTLARAGTGSTIRRAEQGQAVAVCAARVRRSADP
jgi:hypothetical protein